MFIVYNPNISDIVAKYARVNFSIKLQSTNSIVVDDDEFIKLISDTQQAVDILKSFLLGSDSCKDVDRYLVLNSNPNFLKGKATSEFHSNNELKIDDLCQLWEALSLKNAKYVRFYPWC